MKRLIRKSIFLDGLKVKDNYYEIYKNPSKDDSENILKYNNIDTFAYIRGIMCIDGDMYVWSVGLLHDKAIGRLNIPDGMHFDIEQDLSLEIRIPNISLDEFIKKIESFKIYLSNLGITDNSDIYISCNQYATSLNKDFDNIHFLKDLWKIRNENVDKDEETNS